MGQALEDIVAEMVRLRKSLPTRPSLDALESAQRTIKDGDARLAFQLQDLVQQSRPESVPIAVFRAYQDMREEALRTEALEQQKSASALSELEERHRYYDALIQKAHAAIQSRNNPSIATPADTPTKINGLTPSSVFDLGNLSSDSLDSSSSSSGRYSHNGLFTVDLKQPDNSPHRKSRSDHLDLATSFDFTPKTTKDISSVTNEFSRTPMLDSLSLVAPSSRGTPQLIHSNGAVTAFEPLSTIDEDGAVVKNPLKPRANLKEGAAKMSDHLDLHGASLSELHWAPSTIGHLCHITSLDVSRNRLTSLPDAIGELSSLAKLNLSSNKLVSLPETLGNLSLLTHLNFENNSVEELPTSIGKCSLLIEINADFNKLKALPESIGQLSHLRCLSTQLNNIKRLPTTMSSLSSLEELNVRFNQLEFVSDGICSITTLRHLDLSSNFNDLRDLPEAIGDLLMLQYLDVSNNHLTMLPISVVKLKNLSTLNLEGNPWQFPPLYVAQQGKEAVMEYLVSSIANEELSKKVVKEKSGWEKFLSSINCCISGRSTDLDDLTLNITA